MDGQTDQGRHVSWNRYLDFMRNYVRKIKMVKLDVINDQKKDECVLGVSNVQIVIEKKLNILIFHSCAIWSYI